MYSCYPFIFIFLAIIFSFKKTDAQTAATQRHADSYINTKDYFLNEIKEDAHLYTGTEYINYPINIKGIPFFETDQMQSSAIFYDGTLYENISILYDIVRQQIVITRYRSNERINLITEKIKYFVLDGHRFENILSIEGKDENVINTIYEIMTDGKTNVLIKRIKQIKNGLKAEDPTFFKEEDELYIKKEKNLYPVTNKNSVVEALSDKRDLIKIFIRKNKFRFKKNIEKELIITANYYSTLNK